VTLDSNIVDAFPADGAVPGRGQIPPPRRFRSPARLCRFRPDCSQWSFWRSASCA
jgi:hypothetical protein